MNIPFFDLKRQYEGIKEDVEKAIVDVSRSCGYIEGKAVKDFEAEMAEYLDVKHVISCASGTDSLELALRACGVRAGDEVITTAFSFFATAEAISAIGAIPVFADVRETDYNIDPDSVEKLITEKTKAILPVHIFGSPYAGDEINQIAEKHGLVVIEDSCQAIGSAYKGKKAGTIGTASGFSFYPTKNLGAFGDGGMVTTNDDSVAMVTRALKAHAGGKGGFQAAEILGVDTGSFVESAQEATELYDPYKYYNYLIGGNSRLDSIQAAVLSVKLKKLDEYNSKRDSIAARYNKAFADLPVHLPPEADDTITPCWHQYVFLTDDKDGMISYLGEHGVGAGMFYPVPLHLQKAFNDLGYKEGDLPVSESVCKRSVCLPVFPELTDEEVEYVIETVCSYFKKQSV
ncbi:MAG: DegT/DnrJ/EryC1/StrS family aminotransferase [Clostridiales bacterium]|nr:DegT/DnrJ/EryC1/StrS family aminotransferase [Clostridiales bacterium]